MNKTTQWLKSMNKNYLKVDRFLELKGKWTKKFSECHTKCDICI